MPASFAFSLCADDYALTPGVSRGILEALDAGALTATSVMTTSPFWPDAAAALTPHAERADVGLHLNLTVGVPLGPMPTLAPRTLPDIRTIIRLARADALPLDEIEAEIARQCERFVTVFGRPPDHVDGHQHVHALRAIRPLVLKVLGDRGWRPWLRDSADRIWRIPWRGAAKKAFVVGVLADGFGALAKRHGFLCNDGFAGYSPFDPLDNYALLFESYMKMHGPRHLVMCHPGYVDDALRALDPVLETREQELRFLISGLGQVLERNSAALQRMSSLRPS